MEIMNQMEIQRNIIKMIQAYVQGSKCKVNYGGRVRRIKCRDGD